MLKIGVVGHRTVKGKGLVELRFLDVVQKHFPNDEQLQFQFGSNSQFNALIWKIVSKAQEDGENVTLVNFACGSEKPLLKDNKKDGQKWFDEVVFPENAKNCGRRLYIERNKALIDASDVMLFYFDETYSPAFSNSGTRIAYEYAKSKNKKIINLFK